MLSQSDAPAVTVASVDSQTALLDCTVVCTESSNTPSLDTSRPSTVPVIEILFVTLKSPSIISKPLSSLTLMSITLMVEDKAVNDVK